MALANKKIISFRNVTKEYPNGVLGLKDLNIDIDQGGVCDRCWVVWWGNQPCCVPSTACTKSPVAKF